MSNIITESIGILDGGQKGSNSGGDPQGCTYATRHWAEIGKFSISAPD